MNEHSERRLAILDDDVHLCAFMREVAQLAGFHTSVAHDGRNLAQLLASNPEILLLDLAMPHVDGVEVIRQLAKIGFAGSLVLISGFDPLMLESTKMLAELQGVRVADVLSKPIDAQTLLNMLESLKRPL